jgi:hypothetical protein
LWFPAAAFACTIALSIPSVTYITSGYFATDGPGGRWLGTKIGTP